jgi:hypothetical protein
MSGIRLSLLSGNYAWEFKTGFCLAPGRLKGGRTALDYDPRFWISLVRPGSLPFFDSSGTFLGVAMEPRVGRTLAFLF